VAGCFDRVSPAGLVGVEGGGDEDFAGAGRDDGNGGVVGDQYDGRAAVVGVDAEVVRAGGAVEAGFPALPTWW
jgi:hypothetical protein